MPKKSVISLLLSVILVFSVPFAFAEKQGTCKNPDGGNYCGANSKVSSCWCDDACTKYNDCCTDYKNVCNAEKKPVEKTCPLYSCAEPPTGCYWSMEKDANGCQTCGKLVCETSCPSIYEPVCGYNGKTYGNSCEAGKAGVKVECNGECPCKKECAKDSDCPEIVCIQAPCPKAVCKDGKCVSETVKCTTWAQTCVEKGEPQCCDGFYCVYPNEAQVDEGDTGSCVEKKPKCSSDSDCMPINPICTGGVCPKNSCVNGKCVPPICGNGICEEGEANECPACVYATPPCMIPCKVGTCPQDCQKQTIAEQVKCIFQDSATSQKCVLVVKYQGQTYNYGCSGVNECSFTAEAPLGTEVVLDSSCSGTNYVTFDGKEGYYYFNCGSKSITKKDVINWIDQNCYEQVAAQASTTPAVTGNAISDKIFVKKQYWKN